LASSNRPVPARLEHIVFKCLEKDGRRRYADARDLLSDLRKYSMAAASRKKTVRTRAMAAILSAAAIVAIGWWFTHSLRIRWAEAQLAEAWSLAESEQFAAAYRRLLQLEPYIPVNPRLRELRGYSTLVTSVHEPVEKTDQSEVATIFPFQLFTHGPAPGMTYIRTARPELFSLPPTEVPAFWIDKFEVTNKDFQAFVDRGPRRLYRQRILDGTFHRWRPDAFLERVDVGISRHYRSARTGNLGASATPGRTRRLSRLRRQLVRSGGVLQVRRKEPADSVSLVSCRLPPHIQLHRTVQQLQRQGSGARGKLPQPRAEWRL
jgi:hypothetical protein